MTLQTQRTPFLRVQRNFPQDPQALSVEINRSYIDIAGAVNARTIGIFPVNAPVVTGDSWFLSGQENRQQVLRQVYQFTAAGNIPHGIILSQISGFTRIYGTFTDGSIWYPLPYVNVTAANNQISVTVTGTNIVITRGGGSPPAVSSGFVVLEWLSQV